MSNTESQSPENLVADSTIVAHDDAKFPYGAVVPPIVQSSTYSFDSYEQMVDSLAGKNDRHFYGRYHNPTVRELEHKIAALEGADDCRAFSSGMGAISSAVLSQVRAGDRVLCVRYVYPDAYRLFDTLLRGLGIEVEYVDGTDHEAVAAALPGCRLLYLESPTSWIFESLDLEALSAMARKEGAITIVDNSWATPINQKPILAGADMVVHAGTKYLSGHSDTVVGFVAGSQDKIDSINDNVANYLGAKLAPFEAFLAMRGLRTLPLRMAQCERSGRVVAERLRDHDAVTRLYYPGLNDKDLKTLKGCSSMLSFELSENFDIATLCNSLSFIRLGLSWGGHESLLAPVTPSMNQKGDVNPFRNFELSPRLIRFYVGLEDVEDVWGDVAQALEKARKSEATVAIGDLAPAHPS